MTNRQSMVWQSGRGLLFGMFQIIAVGALLSAWDAAAEPARPPQASAQEPSLGACDVEKYASGAFNDYRLRETDGALQWSVGDIKNNHLDPALRRMASNDYSRNVIADLDFMLRGWPNHYPALEALVRYDLAGGRAYDFHSVPCYFARAKAFAADDVVVRMQEGYYYWRKKQMNLAERAYKEALMLEPKSAEAHYNLGLLYADRQDYPTAMTHAAAAYRAGYPLMGLRRKLEKAGAWREPQGNVATSN